MDNKEENIRKKNKVSMIKLKINIKNFIILF